MPHYRRLYYLVHQVLRDRSSLFWWTSPGKNSTSDNRAHPLCRCSSASRSPRDRRAVLTLGQSVRRHQRTRPIFHRMINVLQVSMRFCLPKNSTKTVIHYAPSSLSILNKNWSGSPSVVQAHWYSDVQFTIEQRVTECVDKGSIARARKLTASREAAFKITNPHVPLCYVNEPPSSGYLSPNSIDERCNRESHPVGTSER